ncbi:MAG TPA: amidophosphoribosyltransferase [Flavobacteriales bacterium]|jgi:amidophosphoribosyltransferase|nr:amidophosphoribosyltransferase [Flavobacteriales bacterium]
MSEAIKHECGLAFVRLLKPLDYYHKKYGTAFYGLNKLYLLMEKQHNRGQDGVGVANIKLNVQPGQRYISRHRSINTQPIQDVFQYINKRFKDLEDTQPSKLHDVKWLKENKAFTGEIFLGHLRYGTFGKNSIEACHPFLRQNNWMTRNLVLAGNFNLTNADELFDLLVRIGQHPKEVTDTVTVMEKIGHFLDMENQELFDKYKTLGYSNQEISDLIAKNVDITRILERASEDWDGGYHMVGILGHGDAFAFRDPNGIRPAFYYQDEEVVVVASERPAIQTVFGVPLNDIQELGRGKALIIKKDGDIFEKQIIKKGKNRACSFERIYFSRGSDSEIYEERKKLGANVFKPVIESVKDDFFNTVFSYIPNTAEVSFYGLIGAAHSYLNELKTKRLKELGPEAPNEEIEKLLNASPRFEKLAIKDAKLRTFITQDDSRDDLVAHVYDVTYGVVKPEEDTLVMIDDSIVRGTTLRQSILRILDTLNPKKIIIVSSAPQIRFPDCYGIDMAKMGDFIAFRAAVELHKQNGTEKMLDQIYKKCKDQENLPKEQIVNYVKEVYEPFTYQEVSDMIAELVSPNTVNAQVEVIYQTLEGLQDACPNHKGDWYFSGNYPTPGGNKVVNKAFINYIEGKDERAY